MLPPVSVHVAAAILPPSTLQIQPVWLNGTTYRPVIPIGHASASTTENFYAHIIEENKAKASECIAGVLLRKKAQKIPPKELDGVTHKNRFLTQVTQN